MGISTSAENFSLLDAMKLGDKPFAERVAYTNEIFQIEYQKEELLYQREILATNGRELTVKDPYSGKNIKLLMFGSNNYLGFANHPYILQKINELCPAIGTGLGGPPLLNGHTSLHAGLEKKIADLKFKESALIFSSGYAANIGLTTALFNRKTMVIFDEFSHASFIDGLLMSKARFKAFKHNDMEDLRNCLKQSLGKYADVFVATEGVFSMDGDIGKIDHILMLKKEYPFLLIVDDAHGLGVIGNKGHGVHEYFNTRGIDVLMGTFSKTLASTGGFIAASREIIHYLRYMARSYMFSAALPPAALAQVLGGLELLDMENWRVTNLRKNIALIHRLLDEKEIPHSKPESAITTIIVPENRNIRRIGKRIHNDGIFLNTIEYPAVPKNVERLRISLMAVHTEEDIIKLVQLLEKAVKG